MIDDEGSFHAPTSQAGERRAAFLAVLAETRSVVKAAEASGWDRRSAYRDRRRLQEFAAAWDAAVGRACTPSRSRQRRRWTATTRALFLEALAETANASEALRRVGISGATAYRQRRLDPAFAQAWDDAFEAALDSLEAVAVARARIGSDKVVMEKGREVRRTREPSDGLLMFLLRRHRPARWGRGAIEAPAAGASTADVRARIIAKVEAISARLVIEGDGGSSGT